MGQSGMGGGGGGGEFIPKDAYSIFWGFKLIKKLIFYRGLLTKEQKTSK